MSLGEALTDEVVLFDCTLMSGCGKEAGPLNVLHSSSITIIFMFSIIYF